MCQQVKIKSYSGVESGEASSPTPTALRNIHKCISKTFRLYLGKQHADKGAALYRFAFSYPSLDSVTRLAVRTHTSLAT